MSEASGRSLRLTGARLRGRSLLLGLVLIVAGCGGRGGEGDPAPAPRPPELAGVRIMLLPVPAQAPGALDAELAFWLEDRLPATDWVLPAELQAAADRAPAWRLQLETLPRPVVDVGAGDRRVRDPLYGALRQLGAVVHADYALVPLEVAEGADSAGIDLALAVGIVEIRGGRVVWLHTAQAKGNPSREVAVATVAELVARSLLP